MNTIPEELVARENFELCVFGFVKYKFKNHEGMSEVGSIEVARMLLGRNYFGLLPWHLAASGVGLAVLNCREYEKFIIMKYISLTRIFRIPINLKTICLRRLLVLSLDISL